MARTGKSGVLSLTVSLPPLSCFYLRPSYFHSLLLRDHKTGASNASIKWYSEDLRIYGTNLDICTVKDAAYVLQAIAGKDPNDNYTSAIPFDTLPDYVAACNFSALRGKRIGIPRNLIEDEPGSGPVLAAFEAAIATVRAAGATVLDSTNITADPAYFSSNASLIVLEADFVADLPSLYLAQLASNPNDITDLAAARAFTQDFAQEEYPSRDTDIWDDALALGFDNTDPEFWPYYQQGVEAAGPQGILGLLKNYSLDALMLPTDFSPGLPALIGTPVVTVPSKSFPGLPV